MTSTWSVSLFLFFFNDPAPTEIYTLSLHDALPICSTLVQLSVQAHHAGEDDRFERWFGRRWRRQIMASADRKSTRLNSSHSSISYAVFCLKKKKKHARYHSELQSMRGQLYMLHDNA